MTIHYRVFGEGPPIIFFHGWGFDSTIWKGLLPELTSKFKVFLIDLPGFGRSSMMEWPIFKVRLLKLLPQRFALAGWSMGGLYATRLALEESARVTHLLNIATSPKFIKEEAWPGIEPRIFKGFNTNLARRPLPTLEQFIKLQLKGQNENSVIPSRIPNKEGLTAGLDSLLNWDLRSELTHLDIPVCYLFGRLDSIAPAHTMDIMKKKYPQFKYELFSQSAHVPFLSQQQDFLRILKDFVR